MGLLSVETKQQNSSLKARPSSFYTLNVKLKKESALCDYYLKYPLMMIASVKKRDFSHKCTEKAVLCSH